MNSLFFTRSGWSYRQFLSRFDGVRFKYEASSKFPHYMVTALGSYRGAPFVTGNFAIDDSHLTNGLETEILDYEKQEWVQADDYPFSSNR